VRLAYKILIALGIAFVAFFGVPTGIALAKGKSEALRGLIQTLKYILKAHKETIGAMVKAYVKFLSSL